MGEVFSGATSMNGDTDWVSLVEYAVNTGVSLSTLRRHIKSGKLLHRLENGKYLVPLGPEGHELPEASVLREAAEEAKKYGFSPADVELQKAREEIAELKMLVALYEERLGGRA